MNSAAEETNRMRTVSSDSATTNEEEDEDDEEIEESDDEPEEEGKYRSRFREPIKSWRRKAKRLWLIEDEQKAIKLRRFLRSNIFNLRKYNRQSTATESNNDIVVISSPIDAVLSLVEACPDYCIQKPSSLSGTIIREFDRWLGESTTRKNHYLQQYIDENIQLRALQIATAKHTVHLDVFIRIFQLDNETITPKVIEHIKTIISRGDYKDACQSVIALRLQSHFDLDDIVLPCLLQDRGNLVEAYINGNRDLQLDLISRLDQFIDADDCDSRIQSAIDAYHKRGVVGIRREKLVGKALQKLVARLVKQYQLPTEAAPNLQLMRTQGSIRHMAFKRFDERSVSQANFDDYVGDAVRDRHDLQRYLINVLIRMRQLDEAIKWADRYKLPYASFTRLRSYIDSNKTANRRQSPPIQSNTSDTDGVLHMPSNISISLIETRDQLSQCIEEIFSDQQSIIIGIDTEWRPLFLCSNEQLAIIQIATRHNGVYLIDIIALEKILNDNEWIEFFQQLLCTDKAIKIGFDFAGDLRVIAATLPCCQSLISNTKNVICMAKIAKQLIVENPAIFDMPFVDTTSNEPTISNNHSTSSSELDDSFADDDHSLSHDDGLMTRKIHFKLTDLCAQILGKPLDKSEQFGNWAKRPLRREQLQYAALDAYCLLDLFDQFKCRASLLAVDWDALLANATVGTSESNVRRQRRSRTKITDEEFDEMIKRCNAATASDGTNPRSPADLHIIVDSMIQGLGKHLRRCGVDCIIADDRDALVKLARQQHRCALSNGKAFLSLRSRLPADQLVCIPQGSSISTIGQVEFVLKHFGVRVTEKDIFSRCMVCNSSSYLFVPAPLLACCYAATMLTNDLFNPQPFDRTSAINTINAINPAEYNSHRVTIIENSISRLLVQVDGGTFDVITGNIDNQPLVCIESDDQPAAIRIKIEAMFPTSFADTNRLFFICHDCGKIYWDGAHLTNYVQSYGSTLING